MEENNDILLDGFDALVYLANQCTKEKLLLSCKNSFIWYCRSVSTYFNILEPYPSKDILALTALFYFSTKS